MKLQLIYGISVLFVPVESFAAYSKGQPTLANTAILSLILLPILLLLLVFAVHKYKLNRKNVELLNSMALQDRKYDPGHIESRVRELIGVIASGQYNVNSELVRKYLTADLFARFCDNKVLLSDYEAVSYGMIMAIEGNDPLSINVVVSVNCLRKSATGRRQSRPEAWRFVHDANRWLLDDMTETAVTDYY